MSSATLICQIGFGHNSKKGEAHFPILDGRNIGYKVKVPTSDNPYSPYTYAGLVSGDIPYDLLPVQLKAIIDQFAHDAYKTILETNPSLQTKLKRNRVRVRFYEILDSRTLQ